MAGFITRTGLFREGRVLPDAFQDPVKHLRQRFAKLINDI